MHESHPLGTIARLWRYPTKSLAAVELDRSAVSEHGFVGDRREALFVETPDHARAGRTYRGKENALLHTVSTAARARDLAAERDLDVEVRGGGPHFDAGTVSLITDTWLDDLARHAGLSLDPLRFRPNIFVATDENFTSGEDDLIGCRFAAGTALFHVTATIKRCVTTTYDIATGESQPIVLRACARHRANVMGVYCDVLRPGDVERGDAIVLSRP